MRKGCLLVVASVLNGLVVCSRADNYCETCNICENVYISERVRNSEALKLCLGSMWPEGPTPSYRTIDGAAEAIRPLFARGTCWRRSRFLDGVNTLSFCTRYQTEVKLNSLDGLVTDQSVKRKEYRGRPFDGILVVEVIYRPTIWINTKSVDLLVKSTVYTGRDIIMTTYSRPVAGRPVEKKVEEKNGKMIYSSIFHPRTMRIYLTKAWKES